MKKIIKNILTQKIVNELLLFIYSVFFINRNVKRFNDFIKQNVVKKDNGIKKDLIIVDFFPVEETLIAYSFFINALVEKHHASVMTYCYGNALLPFWAQSIYKAFGSKKILRISLSKEQKTEVAKIFSSLENSIKTKVDLINFRQDGVTIGIDIYESVLRDYNVPTVDILDQRVWTHIKRGLELYVFWKDFFESNSIKAVVLSHDNYMWMNILAKIGYKNKIAVYLPSGRYIVKPYEDFSTYKLLNYYKTWFQTLSEELKKEGTQWAKKQIEERFSGKITEEVYYAEASPYANNSTEFLLKGSSSTKILIASHCFFDNPHPYAHMAYPDFQEWLIYLGSISLKTNYDWYLKMHPDPLPGTLEIILEFIAKHPHITLIPHDISHHNLIKQGMNWVITCHGTIGEEYPLLGANVINCAYNSRISYDFNYHFLTPEDLGKNIVSLENLSKREHDKNEIYQFIFCHHRLRFKDNLIFKSYRKYLAEIGEYKNIKFGVFEYYLKNIDKGQLETSKKIIKDYIDSNKTYLTELGPLNLTNENNIKVETK